MGKNGSTRAKFLLKLFLKSLRFPKAAPWSLSAESEISLRRFSFWLEQERARWAIKRVRSTEKTRSIECDLAFKATMFLTGQVFFFCALCVKRKSVMGGEFVKNGPSRTPVPTGFGENFDVLLVGEGLAPPLLHVAMSPKAFPCEGILSQATVEFALQTSR